MPSNQNHWLLASQAWYRCVSVDLTWPMNPFTLTSLQLYLEKSACAIHDIYIFLYIQRSARMSCNRRSYTTLATKTTSHTSGCQLQPQSVVLSTPSQRSAQGYCAACGGSHAELLHALKRIHVGTTKGHSIVQKRAAGTQLLNRSGTEKACGPWIQTHDAGEEDGLCQAILWRLLRTIDKVAPLPSWQLSRSKAAGAAACGLC